MKKNRVGQSTLEYLLLVTVIIAAVFTFAKMKMKDTVGASLDSVINGMNQATQR